MYLVKRITATILAAIIGMSFIFLLDKKDTGIDLEIYYTIYVVMNSLVLLIGYDYLNYDLDIKKKNHHIHKNIFLIMLIVFNLIALVLIALMNFSSIKWILVIGVLVSNTIPYLIYKTKYLIALEVLVIGMLYLLIDFNPYKIIIVIAYAIITLIYIYFEKHKKTKVYTYDNYD